MNRSTYQGRALWTAPVRARRGVRPGWILVGLLVASGALFLSRERIARTAPYRAVFTVPRTAVVGAVYMGEDEVRRAAGLDRPVDFLGVDLGKARRKLARSPRVAEARIRREFPRRIVIRIVERKPVAIVRGGRLFETDERGVILPPLVSGVLPDVPLVSGVRVADARAGKTIADPDYARALRHLAALALPDVGLPHPVSQVDVSDPTRTVVTLAPDGVDVYLPHEPPQARTLSALRVVLADLASRNLSASSIDLMDDEVIAVRPVRVAATAADSTSSMTREPRRG